MNNNFSYISELVKRTKKPRNKVGTTSIIDTGLGVSSCRDLISTAGEYIDVVKLGWTTWTLLPETVLREKIGLYRANNILTSPGGTATEVAYIRGKFEIYLGQLKELGFDLVEVSDGCMDMTPEKKRELITLAAKKGFEVVSEVGKKDPQKDAKLETTDRINQIKYDLESGANRVIIEAREGGVGVGVYDFQGRVKSEEVDRIVKGISLEKLVFEAPNKDQQIWFVNKYGPNVSLANIQPYDVIKLETLRRGIRGDTFGKFWEK